MDIGNLQEQRLAKQLKSLRIGALAALLWLLLGWLAFPTLFFERFQQMSEVNYQRWLIVPAISYLVMGLVSSIDSSDLS